MKTINEAAKENFYDFEQINAFKAGVKFAQSWIPVSEELPPLGIECIFKSDKWINEDFNPQGIRIGFKDDLMGYVSSYWCDYHDCYMTRYSNEDDESLELSKGIDQIPTHWKPIERK